MAYNETLYERNVMFASSKIGAAWAAFGLVCMLVIAIVVSMSFADLDRPQYPIPVENRPH